MPSPFVEPIVYNKDTIRHKSQPRKRSRGQRKRLTIMPSPFVEPIVYNKDTICHNSRPRKRGRGQRKRRAKDNIKQQPQKLSEATYPRFISFIKYTKPCTVSQCLTSSLDTDENKKSADRHIDLLKKSIDLSVVSIEEDCINHSNKESELSSVDLKKDTSIHLCEESFKLSNIDQDNKPVDNENMFIGGQSPCLSKTDKKCIPVVCGQILSSEESTSQAEVPNTVQMTDILEDVKPFSSHETFCHYLSTLLLSIPESSEKEELKFKIVDLVFKFKKRD